MFVVWISGFGADAASTHRALRAGGEDVLLSQNPWINHALVGAEAGGGAWALHRLLQRHRRLAIGLGLSLGALRAGIAVHNLHTARALARSR
jgi:hypothetical protein